MSEWKNWGILMLIVCFHSCSDIQNYSLSIFWAKILIKCKLLFIASLFCSRVTTGNWWSREYQQKSTWHVCRTSLGGQVEWAASFGERCLEKVTVFTREQTCAIWILIRIAQFEWSFEDGILDHDVRKITSRCVIWIAQIEWSFKLRNSN